MSHMTNKERVEALLRRRKPDRVPIWPIGAEVFAVLQAGGLVADTWNKPEMCLKALQETSQKFDWVCWPRMFFHAMIAALYGVEVEYPVGEYAFVPSVVRRPIHTIDEAMKLKLPDVRNSGFIPQQLEFYKKSSLVKLDNKPFSVTLAVSVFSHAAEIPGPETFARWLIKEKDAAHHLLRLSLQFSLEQAKYWREIFGAENVLPYVGEPTAANQLISPKQFQQFVLPYIKQLNEGLLSLGYKHILCHICGEQNANLPYWAQVPMGNPGIVSVGHEVPLETAARFFPDDIIFGNLAPAVIQSGTPTEVYEATRTVLEAGKKIPNGFIFSSGCTFPPRANPENVMSISKAVNDFGYYA